MKKRKKKSSKVGTCAASGCAYEGPVFLFKKLYWCPIHLTADSQNANGCKDDRGLKDSALSWIG
jgi:hypothetical protein